MRRIVHTYRELMDLLIELPNDAHIRYRTLPEGFEVRVEQR